MKWLLFVAWLTPSSVETYHVERSEASQCAAEVRQMSDVVQAADETQLFYAGCIPVAPGMLEAVGA